MPFFLLLSSYSCCHLFSRLSNYKSFLNDSQTCYRLKHKFSLNWQDRSIGPPSESVREVAIYGKPLAIHGDPTTMATRAEAPLSPTSPSRWTRFRTWWRATRQRAAGLKTAVFASFLLIGFIGTIQGSAPDEYWTPENDDVDDDNRFDDREIGVIAKLPSAALCEAHVRERGASSYQLSCLCYLQYAHEKEVDSPPNQ